ncbi:MAG TPA: hypothetical protein VE287_03375, partial [Actinopolymorphaceae bacterium]|nr:hypothetical protein [Actinopolymorphaceae bacterium]
TDFALWVTNAQNQLTFCKLVTIFPSTRKSLDDPFFHKFSDDPSDQARKIVVDELPHMKPFMLGTDQDIQLEQALGNEIVAYFLGKQSATGALHKASDEWNKVLSS